MRLVHPHVGSRRSRFTPIYEAPAMEVFPDRAHVRLQSPACGRYLHADEDGWGVSLSVRRESIRTVWQVHRIVRDGNPFVLLHGAAYGRYLALSPTRRGVIQAIYLSSSEQDVVWEAKAIELGSGRRRHLLLRSAASPSFFLSPSEDKDGNTDRCWVVETVPKMSYAPSLQRTNTLSSTGNETRRVIYYVMMDFSGNCIPGSLDRFEFSGRSTYDLRAIIARRINKHCALNITLCLCAGSQGRLTPLISDLTASEDAIAIAVFHTGSKAALELRHPNVDAQ